MHQEMTFTPRSFVVCVVVGLLFVCFCRVTIPTSPTTVVFEIPDVTIQLMKPVERQSPNSSTRIPPGSTIPTAVFDLPEETTKPVVPVEREFAIEKRCQFNYRLHYKCIRHAVLFGVGASDVISFLGPLLLRLSRAQTRPAFIDVGSNNGQELQVLVNVLAPCKACDVVAIEPNAAFQAQLRGIAASVKSPRVTVVHGAVMDDAHDNVSVYLVGGGELGKVSTTAKSGQGVKTVSVSRLMRDLGTDRLIVLKVDAEGFDSFIITKMLRTIRRMQTQLIVFELSHYWKDVPREGSVDPVHAVTALHRIGYRCFLVAKFKDKSFTAVGQWVLMLLEVTPSVMWKLQDVIQWEAAMAVPDGGDVLKDFLELQKTDMESPAMWRWRKKWSGPSDIRYKCKPFVADQVDCWRVFVTHDTWRMLQSTTVHGLYTKLK